MFIRSIFVGFSHFAKWGARTHTNINLPSRSFSVVVLLLLPIPGLVQCRLVSELDAISLTYILLISTLLFRLLCAPPHQCHTFCREPCAARRREKKISARNHRLTNKVPAKQLKWRTAKRYKSCIGYRQPPFRAKQFGTV